MSTTRPLDVVIVEDEPHLAELHREYIEQNFHLRVVGIAASIEQACRLIRQYQPRLILLDNYLPDGKGVELIDNPLLKSYECSVIFITAASDMQTCSHAMRSGAFDYLIKPVFFQRLHASLERFMRFIHTVQQVKVVDQHALDRLFNLPAAEAPITPSTKGIDPKRWNGLNACSPSVPTTRCRSKRWWKTWGSAKPRDVATLNTAWRAG